MTIGQTLKGRYKLLERIGTGGMSTVYLARVLDTGQTVAVKVVNDTLAFDEQYIHRFSQELAIARLLTHPGIPRLIDDGETEEGVPFIVMEYVQGITLTEYIKKKGPLPIEEAVAMTEQVLSILSYAYSKGIQAHRDIKPGNIMIDLRTHAVTVMDFGIAKTVGSSLTHSTVLYTPKYAAPEQLLPSKFGGVVDKRADLYAVGVVLYEMLTGRAPFNGETPAEISGEQITSAPPSPSVIRTDIPAPLSQVLLKCLQPNPSHRYQTPQDLLQDLKAGYVREPRQTPAAARENQETVTKKVPPTSPVLRQEPKHPVSPAPEQQPPPRRRSKVFMPLLLIFIPCLLTLLVAAIIQVTALGLRNRAGTPTAVKTATLTVTSSPPGARVFLDDKDTGETTPYEVKVTPGTYRVRLNLISYDAYYDSLYLNEGEVGTVNALLAKTPVAPATGALWVTSTPSGARIYLNGVDSGEKTPWSFENLAVGTYTVRCSISSAYEDASQSATVKTGESISVDLSLARVVPQAATIALSSTPSQAIVYVDGNRWKSMTPCTITGLVSGRAYTLRIEKTGCVSAEKKVTAKSGSTTVSVSLQSTTAGQAHLSITSFPSGALVFVNGVLVGTTPYSGASPVVGPVSIQVEKTGYAPESWVTVLQRGQQYSLPPITLRPQP